jgi:hypothetical protein
MSIIVDEDNLHVGDDGDSPHARAAAEQFMDWLASTKLELNARQDPRQFLILR